jgi:hypothetical protein
MRLGTIEEAARSDNRFSVWVSALLTTACVLVLAIHARYLYNWVAGPFPIEASQLADPGWHRFVRAQGELEHSGVIEETSRRIARFVEVHREETAEFFMMQVGDRLLLVKVPREFSGNVVEGQLVETPERVRELIDRRLSVHHWMIDAEHSFRGDVDVPFVLALLLIVPAGWWLVSATKRARSILRHSAIAPLAAHGDPLEVIDRIEREMMRLGEAAHVGPYWISSSWWVSPTPLLKIAHARDVIGVARRTRKLKNADKHEVLLWQRGRVTNDSDAMSAQQTAAVVSRVAACMPWAVVTDPEGFARRWIDDRAAEEAAVQARYESRASEDGPRAAT